jgi:hypothetical protein
MATFSLSKPDLAAHRQSLTLPLPAIASGLVSVIGKKLTAYIGNAKDVRAVDRWIAGVEPYKDSEPRLRFAYHVVMTLREQDTSEVVQAWLMGVNPELGDRTPIRMLKEEPLDTAGPLLLGAARAFASGG